MTNNGYTLKQMLIAHTIIALMAFPVVVMFQSARKKAKEIRCKSNLDQIGKGLIFYKFPSEKTPGSLVQGMNRQLRMSIANKQPKLSLGFFWRNTLSD